MKQVWDVEPHPLVRNGVEVFWPENILMDIFEASYEWFRQNQTGNLLKTLDYVLDILPQLFPYQDKDDSEPDRIQKVLIARYKERKTFVEMSKGYVVPSTLSVNLKKGIEQLRHPEIKRLLRMGKYLYEQRFGSIIDRVAPKKNTTPLTCKPQNMEELYKTDVSALQVPQGVINSIKRNKIDTVGQLIDVYNTPKSLLSLRWIGEESKAKIENELRRLQLIKDENI